MAFPDDFYSARTKAERLQIVHAAEIHRMHVDEQHMAFIGGVRTETETADIMARSLAHWDAHNFGVWMVRDRESNVIAGRVLLRIMPLDGVDEIELGYSYHPSFWGRGLATEVAGACLAEARAHFGFKRFVAVTHPDHVHSQHVLEKLGFRFHSQIERDGKPLALYRCDS